MEIGPALPPHLANKLNSSRDDEDESEKDEEGKSDSDEEESYGPALPPGFQSISTEAVSKPRIIGPMRPQFDTTRPPPVTSNGLYGNNSYFTIKSVSNECLLLNTAMYEKVNSPLIWF